MLRWVPTIWMAGIAVLPAGIAAQSIADAQLQHGSLAFDADATLGAFTGTTTTVSGQLIGANSLGAVRGWVEAPSASLTSHNGHRDRDMGTSLAIDKYPTIRFDLDSVISGAPGGDSTAVTLAGRFTLHGQSRPAAVAGWLWLSGKGQRFRGAIRMNVKDYGVGGLSKMLGMFKMNPMITVRMDVTFAAP